MQTVTKSKPTQAWLSDKDLAQRYGVSRISIWRWAKAGKFPKPRKIGKNTSRWSADEIEAHDKGKIEGVS